MKKRLALLLAVLLCIVAFLPGALAQEEDYKLKQIVILSRHNIRSPLSEGDSLLNRLTTHDWFNWSSAASELSLRGGVSETIMGQYFRKYLIARGLVPDNWEPAEGEARFYTNSFQRTIATAQYFISGFMPTSNMDVEYHYPIGQKDHTFLPIITYMSDSYLEKVTADYEALFGEKGLNGVMESLADNFALLEQALDFANSPYAKENGITSLPLDDTQIAFELNGEPDFTGSLATGFQVADAITLQYYEAPNTVDATFGLDYGWEGMKKISAIVDSYQLLRMRPLSVAVNVAQPILKEIYGELTNSTRKLCYLCGHDSTLISAMSALQVKDYELPETFSQGMPIGGKLCFETYTGADGKEYMNIYLCYQSAEQLRDIALLDEENPPMKANLEFEGLERNEDGLYSAEDVLGHIKNTLKAYDELKVLYP